MELWSFGGALRACRSGGTQLGNSGDALRGCADVEEWRSGGIEVWRNFVGEATGALEERCRSRAVETRCGATERHGGPEVRRLDVGCIDAETWTNGGWEADCRCGDLEHGALEGRCRGSDVEAWNSRGRCKRVDVEVSSSRLGWGELRGRGYRCSDVEAGRYGALEVRCRHVDVEEV